MRCIAVLYSKPFENFIAPYTTEYRYIDLKIIEEIRLVQNSKFDLTKLIKYCEELNSSFSAGNYLSSTLLVKAIINHIPPIFGQETFVKVISQASGSRKKLFSPLEETLRQWGDIHTHDLIRHKENLPTKNQIEPFKSNLEGLLHEIIVELTKGNITIPKNTEDS